MKLRLKTFERNARRLARARLRKSREDWREYKRYRWWRQPIGSPGWIMRGVPVIVAAAFVSGLGVSVGTLLAATFFWSVATLAWRAGQLLAALRSSARLLIFAHLPVSDAEIFQLQWRFFLQNSAASVMDFTACYTLLALHAGFDWNAPIAGLAMALVHVTAIISLATCVVAIGLRRFLLQGAALFAGLALAVLFVPGYHPVVVAIARVTEWVPPMNWVEYVMGFSPPRFALVDWWPAASLAAMLLILPLVYRRLRSGYVLPEGLIEGERERGTVEAGRRAVDDGDQTDPNADIKAAIRTRQFLTGVNWARSGLIERIAGRWLAPGDRLAAEFLTAGKPNWTRPILKGLLVSAVVIALMVVLQKAIPSVGVFLWIMAIALMRKQFDSGWIGTSLRSIGGSQIGMNSVYPVGFWQTTRVILLVHLLQLALLVVTLAVPAIVTARMLDVSVEDLLSWGWRVLAVVLAMMALPPVLAVSKGTNDGDRVRIVGLVVVCVLAVGLSIVAIFAADSPVLMVIAALALFTFTGGALAIYGHAYNHNWFDLQSRPKEQKLPAVQP